jgi:hypothetical protein
VGQKVNDIRNRFSGRVKVTNQRNGAAISHGASACSRGAPVASTRRIAPREHFVCPIADWERQRHIAGARITWTVTTDGAHQIGRRVPRPKQRVIISVQRY